MDQLCKQYENDQNRTNGYLAHHLIRLKQQRSALTNRLDHVVCTALSLIAIKKPTLYQNDQIRDVIYQLFKTDGIPAPVRQKGSVYQQVCLFAANLLWSSHRTLPQWPIGLMLLYLEDSYKNRDWVDHPLTTNFTATLRASLNTVPIDPEYRETKLNEPTEVVTSRFKHLSNLDDHVANVINDQLRKRGGGQDTISKNLLITAALACGNAAVRLCVVDKMENLLNNPKVVKHAQELLFYLCANINSTVDDSVFEKLLTIRWTRSKPSNAYFNALVVMCDQPNNSANRAMANHQIMIQRIVYSELERSRNLSSMQIINHFVSHNERLRSTTASHIARVLLYIIDQQKGDQQMAVCIQSLRYILREMVKNIKSDVLGKFLLTLLNDLLNEGAAPYRINPQNIVEPELTIKRKQIQVAVIDLAHLMIILRTTPLKDYLVNKSFDKASLGKEQMILYEEICEDIPILLQSTIRWVSSKLCILFKPEVDELHEILMKLLFITKKPSDYDQLPTEPERSASYKIIGSSNVLEGTLTRLTIIGGEYLKGGKGLDIFWTVVSRCCRNGGQIQIENASQLAENILQLVSQSKITQTRTMWRGWLTFLLLAAANPSTIGAFGWESFPQLRLLISYCITGTVMLSEEDKQAARRLVQNDRDELSKSDDQLDPSEWCLFSSTVLRVPPHEVINEIDMLNRSIGLDAKLSENRNPDFLLLLMSNQSTSLEWLTRLVQTTKQPDKLPIEVRAEYIINIIDKVDHKPIDGLILKQLQHASADNNKLLEHLISRLSIKNCKTRKNAYTLLQVILNNSSVMEVDQEQPEFNDLINVEKLDLVEFIQKLVPLLESSEKTLNSIISALCVETSLDKIYVYLNLIEFTMDQMKSPQRGNEIMTKTSLALCELITGQPLSVTRRLRSAITRRGFLFSESLNLNVYYL